VRAFGEMVAVLWEAGDVLAAIELEKLWNELADELPFSLLCGYPSASVATPQHAEALREVCHLHSSVLNGPARGETDGPSESAASIEMNGRAEPAPVEMSAEFLAEPDAPAAARRLVADALLERGRNGNLLVDAELVASELATNAVIHAKSLFSLAVRFHDSTLRISVRDGSPVPPIVRDAGPTAIFGRGMRLVDMLCSDWGVDSVGGGKVVWAELRG
jgi:anti-sigma regulatory factor (Ser/Thr protein kinase)